MSKRRLSDADVRTLRELASADARDVDLAARYGITVHAVVMLRTHVRRPEAGGPITRRRPDRAATILRRERIRRALERGETQAAIAEREGVAQSTVQREARPVVGAKAFRALENEVAELRAELAALRARVEGGV